ncbi:MAG: HlyC/CorC family transporter [Bacteroidaceae bacterium]|nr:HlyC/CorC family transporter [Bacteroidaceae bacterium]
MTTLITEIVIVLAFSAFFSGMEIAFVSSNKMRFELDRSQLGWTSRIVARFYQHPNNFISSLLVGNNIALVIYGILMARLLEATMLPALGLNTPSNQWLSLLIETIISTLIVLVTGEFLPKTLFKLNPNRALTFFAPITFLFYIILYPLSKLASSLSKLLLRLGGVKVAPADTDQAFTKVDLDYLIQSSIEGTKNDEDITDEVKIFQNALEFSNCKVRDCIVPRTEIQAVDVHETLHHLKNLFIESGCSKIIVYDGDIDNIVGFIHSSEMFRLNDADAWSEHIKEVPIVPETMVAQKLMRLLMQQKKSLAVVVDEFGGTSGICTLEDLVEEIFGDIEDEHDQNDYIARQLPNGEYELSARMEVEKANEVLGIDLPESDDYLTVGGLILHEYQSFPKLNEVIRIGRFEFKIIKNTSTKIELVRLKIAEN